MTSTELFILMIWIMAFFVLDRERLFFWFLLAIGIEILAFGLSKLYWSNKFPQFRKGISRGMRYCKRVWHNV
jgi:hypothetical protein